MTNLDQSKVFDKDNQLYQVAVFKAAGFEPVFSSWIAAVTATSLQWSE